MTNNLSAPQHRSQQTRFISRFTTKLTVAILLAALLPAAIVSYLCIQTALDSQKSTARELYFAAAERVQDRIMHRVESASSLVLSATALLSNSSIDENSATEAVRSLLAYNEELSALAIYDVRGHAVEIFAKHRRHSLPDVLPERYLAKLTSRSLQQNLIGTEPETLLDGKAPVLPICAVWKSSSKSTESTSLTAKAPVVGYVLVAIESEYLCSLTETISSQMFSGALGRVMMTDTSLRILAYTERKRVAQQESMRGQGIFSTASFRNGLSEYVGTVQDYKTSMGEPMLGVCLYLPLLRMVIVVEEPQTIAYRSLEIMRQTSLLWTLGCAVVASMGCILLVRLFSKPLEQLTEAASRLSEQDFSVRLTEVRADEFGLLFATFNNLAGELAKYQTLNVSRIIDERNKLETVVRQANDGIVLLDGDTNILIVNSMFRAWFDVQGSTEGLRIDALANSNQPLHELALVLHDLSTSLDVIRPCEFSIKKNTELKDRVLRGTLLKIFPENAHIPAHNATLQDHTSPPSAYLLLLRDVTREVETDKLKTELVAVVAHELRSPLNSIYGLAELISEGILESSEMAEYGRTIATQSRKLSDIINKFLDLSRLESGKTEIHRISVRLDAVLRSALTTNAPLAAKKSMRIETRLPENVTAIMGDPDLLGQVFVNLLSNAVKYSLHGKTVVVEIRNEIGAVRVLVIDEGYGISESSQQKLFTKFFRANDDRRVKDESGTGLGLAFVKEIIEQHGGEVGMESRLGEGSTFWFRLPA